MATSNNRAIALEIDQETHDRVQRLANTRNGTSDGVMKEALYQYLEREEKREAFRQETLNAWEEHQSTGLHAMPQVRFAPAALRDLEPSKMSPMTASRDL